MNLYIYKYNNYYNRIVKFEKNLSDYGAPIHILSNCKDFSPNDGVNTQHIFGSAASNYNGSGDYLIVADDENQIISRWFIIEINFNRYGQWNVLLRRDLIVDYNEFIVDAPCFIEKATLSSDDPLVFNQEDMTLNQIKKEEYQLKDNSGCAWIVGYYSKNQELSGTVPINLKSDIPSISLPGSIETWDFYNATNLASSQVPVKGVVESGTYVFGVGAPSASGNTFYDYDIGVNIFDGKAASIYNINVPQSYITSSISFSNISNAFKNYGLDKLNYNNYTGNETQAKITELLDYAGKTIYDPISGKYYNCNINNNYVTKTFDVPQGSALFNSINQILLSVSGFNTRTGFPNNDSFKIQCSYSEYTINMEELVEEEQKYNITDAKLRTEDAPWDIFAIPFGQITVKNQEQELITTNANIGLITAMAMQVNHGSIIHDIQLLPYCPVQELITGPKELTVSNELQYTLIAKNVENGLPVGIIFHVPKSNFVLDISSLVLPSSSSAVEKKVNDACEKWRLTAPNFSNYFDFSVEKNNGIDFFNVDCNYKPFTPYIHINPNFGGLYGYDDNSPRGLVLGGDFSLSQIIDQWQQYQIQNKNFQNIFDRQIQNLEVQQKYGRIQDIVGAITGTAQGAISGAMASKMALGQSVPGGIFGGLTSAAGGLADVLINEQLRSEALDYRKDLFGYQLGNIQALPNTISKVSAFNANNKIFPVLELFSCTDREKLAFIEKIAWNGMSVGVIGKISDYIGNYWNYKNIQSKGYIKGKIIRIENLEDDYHLLNSISEEIYKGAYF